MGNSESSTTVPMPMLPVRLVRHFEEAFRSPSPAHKIITPVPTSSSTTTTPSSNESSVERSRSGSSGSSRENCSPFQRIGSLSTRQRHRLTNRSHSMDCKSGSHVRDVAIVDRTASDNTHPVGTCLRQQPQPAYKISGDLTPQHIRHIRRTWKTMLRGHNEDEVEVTQRLLQVALKLDPHLSAQFGLRNVQWPAIRQNPVFMEHIKAMHPVLSYVMAHLPDANAMSRVLQQLGGRLVTCTTITYKSAFWKVFPTALVETAGADCSTGDDYDAWATLAAFCVEQMRIGYRIELKLQKHMQKIQMKRQTKSASKERS